MLYFVEISILVQQTPLMSMSSRLLNPPGMEKADSHPALLYEALLPFLSKEDATTPSRRWFNRWEGR